MSLHVIFSFILFVTFASYTAQPALDDATKSASANEKNPAAQLKLEELEAMRLKDIEELSQEECAERMQISRQTFQNIIDSARKKVAIALTEGKAINITGGNYTTDSCKFKCEDCGEIYSITYAQDRIACPKCGSQKVVCRKRADFCKKWCRKK